MGLVNLKFAGIWTTAISEDNYETSNAERYAQDILDILNSDNTQAFSLLCEQSRVAINDLNDPIAEVDCSDCNLRLVWKIELFI